MNEPAAERPADHADRERQRAEEARKVGSIAVPLQEGDDPVTGDDADPERGRVHDGNPVEPAVADHLERGGSGA